MRHETTPVHFSIRRCSGRAIRVAGGGFRAKPQAPPHRLLKPGSLDPDTYPGRLTGELTRLLAQKGFLPGVQLELKKRGAEGHLDRLPGLVAELLASKVNVIVAFSYRVAAA